MPVETRIDLSTDDPDVGHGALVALYGGGGPMRFSGESDAFEFAMRAVDAGDLGTDRVRHSMSVDLSMAPLEFFMAGCVRRGSLRRFDLGREPRRLGRGDALCYGRGTGIRAQWSDVEIVTLRVPFDAIDRVARERTGFDGPVRFDDSRPLSADTTRSWRTLTDFVWRESQSSESTLDSPLIAAQLTALVAATALHAFPNSALREGAAAHRDPARPATIRRALAFIDGHADEPLTITTIATAVGVTPRALQYGFARHMDTTPLAYLRQVRLERAHRDLLAADPVSGATVAQIARRWGFVKPGRFAAAYRDVYGQLPSDTLRG